ncbi:MAG: hypothetical protein OXI03_03675, partial [Chloroflexota bacterium]|nr:hypothetical protein [Chloroflexota bacterium]
TRQLRLFVHLGTPPGAAGLMPGAHLGLSPERYHTSIEELGLSVRSYNCLKRSGLMTVGQVLEKSDEQLLGLRNFGEKSFLEVMDRLRELGFLAQDDPRGSQGSIEALQAAEAAAAAGAIGGPSVEVAGEPSAEADEEISSLGTALLEALREAGQDPEVRG